MKRVVIAGGGFAGVAAAHAFERAAKKRKVDVTLADRHNFMLFTPMLPEAASGSIEVRHILQPFRATLRYTAFELGEVIALDPHERNVTLQHPVTHETRRVPYDELILALGSTSSSLGIPGVEKFTIPLKTIADAQTLRGRVLAALEAAAATEDLLERDRLLRFVVIGGSFTGVECAGELRGFLRTILRYYPRIATEGTEIVIVEAGERLLAHLSPKFGKYAAHSLSERGVRIVLGEDVSAVDAHSVELKSGKRFETRTIVWAAGVEPAPVVTHAGLPVTEHGAVQVLGDFSVPGFEHVWAVGDCASVPKPEGGSYPQLAQIAVREGPLVARNVLAALTGKPTKNFRYEKMGQMASLGDRTAVAELPGNRMVTGLPAWMMWRAYYLSRLPGVNKKTRVALDWTLNMVFAPGIARLPLIEHDDVV